VRDLQSLCGRYDLKTIFETRRRNFTCQLYDSSNSLVRVCYVVHVALVVLFCLYSLSVSVLFVVFVSTVVAAIVCE